MMKKMILLSLIGLLLLSGVGKATVSLITSVDNHPPSAPTIDGPTQVRIGIENTWSFYSTDPDGDNITYYVDWGDKCGGAEWHGPFLCNKTTEITHTYQSKNTLLINAMSVDENGAESNITYFEVVIPTCCSIDNFFIRFFERFPYAFPILRLFQGYGIYR